ncbi:MAG: ATP-binding protein [Bacteroidia bacterium]
MNHFEKIIFIRSAGIHYADFDLRGNVHFSGGNGSGKSMLINGISLLVLGKSGISTAIISQLFPSRDSMIVGQWQNTRRAFTVCAFISDSGKLQFLFVSGEYESEIFSSEHIPRTHAEILEQIQKRKLDHIITEPDTEDYPAILWGFARSADQPLVKKFSIGREETRRFYHAYIPGHFRKPDFESTFIRALHRYSLADRLPDLPTIRDTLQRFSLGFSDIHAYEHEKHRIPRILAHAKEIADYESRLKALFSQLKAQHNTIIGQKNEAGSKKEKLLQQLDFTRQQLEELRKTRQEESEKLQLSRDKTFAELQLAQGKFAFYHNHPQAHLLPDLYFLPAKKRELSNSIRELENITGANPKHEASMENLVWEEKQFAQDLKLQQGTLHQNNQRFILEFSAQKLHQKENLIRQFKTKTENLDQQISAYNQKFTSLHTQIRELKSQGKETAKINHLHSEIRRLEEKQLQLTAEGEMIKGGLEILRLKKLYETETEEKLLKESLLLAETTAADLQAQLKQIESQIKNRQGTLYQWLEKNYPDWKKNFGKVLREEVLFHPFLSPEIERLNDLLFGVKMDLSDLTFDIKSVKDMEREKSALEKTIGKHEKETLSIRTESEKRLIGIEKKYQQKFRQAEKDQKKNQYELDLNSSRLRQLRQQQEGSGHEAEKEAEVQAIHLMYEAEEIKKHIHILEGEKDAAFHHLNQSLSAIDREIEKHNAEYEDKLQQTLKALEAVEKETINSFSVRKKALKSGTKPSKADTKPVAALKSIITDLETKIEQLELAENLFWRYRIDTFDYLNRIPLLEDQVKTLDLKINGFSVSTDKEIQLKKEELTRLQYEISANDAHIGEIEDQLRAFENFRQSPVYKTVHSDSVEQEIIQNEKIPVIIRRIREADYAREREEESLKREIHIFVTCFSKENLAGFPVQFDELQDYYRFVGQLQHFYESEQIDILRDQLGAKFARMIHQLAEVAGSLEKRYKSLEENIQAMNRLLSTLPALPSVEKIILTIRPGNHPLLETFAKINAFALRYPHQLGELSLFNQSENAAANREAIHLLESLNQRLRDYPWEEIADYDFAEIAIKTASGNARFFSPGQNYFLQQILRISLLRQTVGTSAEVVQRLHLMIDQAEMLDEKSIRILSEYSNQGGIDLITAAPEVPGAVDYQRVYLLGLNQPLTMFFSLNNNKAFSNGPRL